MGSAKASCRPPRANAGYGEVRWDATVTQQDGEVVATYELLTLVARRDGAASA